LSEVLDLLKGFESINLEELAKVKLLDRMDRKYMFHSSQLPDVLSMAKEYYYILEVTENRYSRYSATYFDTPDHEMYILHHNGKLNRHKVRFRSYVDSDLHYFEIKFKSNKRRTIKSRLKLPDNKWSLEGETGQLLEKITKYKADSLEPALQVNYNRITLASKKMNERITIDFGLNYKMKEKKVELPSLIIAEVKQDRSSGSSFTHIMHDMQIHSSSLSKYCLGIASTVDNIKTNNFKSKIRNVNKILSSHA
jgi:hypothetical protein